ncbi:YhjD/YihY/BrkB family envelope integrity protein [Nakamurella sp.]|uniref:YihY/virulence factor BrkB family protein n=1 Tax=Nakamurella sp. TaxID=1869182 RepID=UPI003B3BE653
MSTAAPPPRDPTWPVTGRPSAPVAPDPGSANGAARAGTGHPAVPSATAAPDVPPTAPGATAHGGPAGAPAGSPADSRPTVALTRVSPGPVVADPAAPDRAGPTQEPIQEPIEDQHTVPWFRVGTGPVAVPAPKVRHRWRKVIGRTLSKAWGDSLFGLSSQAAFWCALSTAPLLLALLGLVGYVVNWYFPAGTIDQIREQILIFLNAIFNEEVADNLVGNTVETILSQGQADVVSVGLVISLWAGSSAMSAFVESITIAYGQHEVRHPVVERFFALGLYLLALLSGIVMLPLLAIGPDYLPKLFPESWRGQVSNIVNVAYYPALALGLIFLLTVLYKVAPKHKHPWDRGVPGAFLAAGVFLVASFGLRLYLSYVYAHGLTYGALATPITFLLFYYFVSMAVIIGAQFNNATLEYYPPRPSKRELRRWQRYDPERDGPVVGAAPEPVQPPGPAAT